MCIFYDQQGVLTLGDQPEVSHEKLKDLLLLVVRLSPKHLQ
jgi:hypothetical protein